MNLYRLTIPYAGMTDGKTYVTAKNFGQAQNIYEAQKDEYEPIGIRKIELIAKRVLIPLGGKDE